MLYIECKRSKAHHSQSTRVQFLSTPHFFLLFGSYVKKWFVTSRHVTSRRMTLNFKSFSSENHSKKLNLLKKYFFHFEAFYPYH